ncbi:hypothetical protein D3C81_190880 [compost metagenome]
MKPTNLALLDPRTIVPGVFKPVTSTDAFEGMTQNLNDDGLYSLEIFGKLGSKERDRTEAFIDVKLPIFNPTYLKALIQIKALYQGILRGAEYGLWDEEAKDFIKSNILEGETGFSAFTKRFPSINFATTDSYKRGQRVTLVNENRGKALTDKVLVIPAGLRDIQFQANGAPTEPEITELYKALMFRVRVILAGKSDANNPLYDTVRWGVQNAFNEIDKYLFGLLEGKGGILQKRMSTRGVHGGTRNVITARKVSRPRLNEDNGVSPNSVDMGLYQSLLNFQYVCIHAMLTKYLERIFTSGSQTAKLVNPKTLEFEYVEVKSQTVEKWTTATGLSKMFNGFADVSLRNKEVVVEWRYLALVYDDGVDVCVLHDINDLPEGKDRKLVRPITYMELFYLSCHDVIAEQVTQQTRYPIIGIGSIFPAKVNLLTIAGASRRIVRSPIDWDEREVCMRYPHRVETPDYFDAMSVDPSREAGLDSDHDGDQLNSNSVCAEDSKEQVNDLFGRREYYISGTGRFLYDPINEPILFMFKAATSGLED